MNKFEKISICLSTTAIIISIIALSKPFFLNLIAPISTSFSIQRESKLVWNSGKFIFTPYFQIHNTGMIEVRPQKIEITIKTEENSNIKLEGENYIPSDNKFNSFLRLSDYSIKPGEILSGSAFLSENIKKSEKEYIDNLTDLALKSANKSLIEKRNKQEMLLSKIADKIVPGSGELNPYQLRSLFPLTLNYTYSYPDENIQNKYREVFYKSTARFKKGEHSASVKLLDFSGRILFEKSYRLTVFEQDVKKLINSFKGFGKFEENGSFSNETNYESFPVLVLKDV